MRISVLFCLKYSLDVNRRRCNLAYQGYLLKFGNTILPWKYIAAESYTTTPSRIIDVDSYRDGNAVLHRSTAEHKVTTVQWDTPYLNNKQVQAMLSIIKAAIINEKERKVAVTYYNKYEDTYKTGEFYIPDIEFPVYKANEAEIIYAPIRIELVEY